MVLKDRYVRKSLHQNLALGVRDTKNISDTASSGNYDIVFTIKFYQIHIKDDDFISCATLLFKI